MGAAGENLGEIKRRRRKIGENEKLYINLKKLYIKNAPKFRKIQKVIYQIPYNF